MTSSILNIIPTESGNIAIDISLNSGSTTLKTSLSRPVLSEVKIVADIPNRNAIQV